jgi:integration host factor subunit alpha
MTKADLVEIVYEKIGGLSKKESQDIVEAIFETMKSSLKQGEKIKISGFGNFTLRDKRPRKGRNPQTGDDIQITARRVLTFRPSQILKTHINVDVEKPT